MTLLATIGSKALYLLFAWLLSATIAAWLSARKGYGERVGLTFGLLLSVAGLVIVLVLPGRPGSRWRTEGPVPPKWRAWVKSRGRPPARSRGRPAPPPAEPDRPA
jgi:hypothetical protein